jgi:hypothetical protein
MMTHFLFPSEESAPSKSLKVPRGFTKSCGYRAADATHSGSTGTDTKIEVTAYLASRDDSCLVNVSRILRLPLQHGFEHIRQLRPFQHVRACRLSANPRAFPLLTGAAPFGTILAFDQDATFQISCEAVMWKITTRDFTLEEVLILAAMNILSGTDAVAKPKKRASQK